MLFPSVFAPGQLEFYAALLIFGFIAKAVRMESRSFALLLVAVVAYPQYETVLVCGLLVLLLSVFEFVTKAS